MVDAWHFVPSTIDATISFKTDVLSAIAGEQRVKRRLLYPRMLIKLKSFLNEYQLFEARTIIEQADNVIDIPDFRYGVFCSDTFDSGDLTLMFDTTDLHTVDTERAIAVTADGLSHVFTVSAKSGGGLTADTGPATTFQNFYIYPVFQGQLLRPVRFAQNGPRTAWGHVEAVITNYKDLSSFAPSLPTFRSRDVALFRDIKSSRVQRSIHRVTSSLDSGTGLIDQVHSFDHVDAMDVMNHHTYGIAESLEREGWLHLVAGRLNEFWRVGWRPDFELAAAASSGASEIEVVGNRPVGSFNGKSLCILQAGATSYHEITNAVDNAPNVTLTLSPTLSFDISPTTVDVISEINLVRLGSDDVTFRVNSDFRTQVAIPVILQDNELA